MIEAIMKLIILLAASLVLGLLFAAGTQWIINHTFSSAFLTFVFGSYNISFWQAFGLNVLVGLLTGTSNTSSKS